MARKLRIQYEGAIYHVMNRGHHRENIFRDDQDRERFLKTLGEACQKTDWQVHAWCLMSNHFHLVTEIPRGNLVDVENRGHISTFDILGLDFSFWHRLIPTRWHAHCVSNIPGAVTTLPPGATRGK